jgi:hypothetical protein
MSDSMNKIDQAIAAAKARKAMKEGKAPPASDSSPTFVTATEVRPGRKVVAPASETAAKLKAREDERNARKAERDAARALKKAERESALAARTPHMGKVEKAAAKLPALGDVAQGFMNDITANCSAADVAALAAHLQHFNRVSATSRALSQKLEVGMTVRIVSGDARYLGRVGVLDRVQRIRCFVTLEGVNKDVYLFTSDVEPCEAEAIETDTDTIENVSDDQGTLVASDSEETETQVDATGTDGE